jgi:cation:H+ antiporter
VLSHHHGPLAPWFSSRLFASTSQTFGHPLRAKAPGGFRPEVFLMPPLVQSVAAKSIPGWTWLAITALLALTAVAVRLGLLPAPLLLTTAACGVAIVCAAFLLTWAAEAAERDISGPLAIGFLSIVALLPEYAVDMYFAWTAGHVPSYAAYAAANMTGGNRLLVGVGWSLVVVLVWFRSRATVLSLARHHTVELSLLGLATLYCFTIPIKGRLSLLDSVVLFAVFAVYIWMVARGPSEQVELIGPAAWLGALRRPLRPLTVFLLFVFSAGVILVCADAFANGLVEIGAQTGIDRFLLVQWIAPLASEAPEIIAVVLLCLRGRPGSGLAVLLASTLNQWTLLVGGLPIAYRLGGGSLAGLPLDPRQLQEFLLTASLSLVAVVTLLNLSLSLTEACVLFAVFVAGVAFQPAGLRIGLIACCLAFACLKLWRQRRALMHLTTWWRTRLMAGVRDPHP